MDISKLPQAQRQTYDSMNMTNMQSEVAIFDGVMAFTLNGTRIEDIIDRQKDSSFVATPMCARKTSPSGGSYYLDFDIGKYMEFIASMIPAATPGMPDLKQMYL